MDIILARYAEVGLKSRGVRRFFETILIDNMIASLAKENIEALITAEQGRIYITTDRITEASSVLTRVFGVASVSPAIISGSSMEEMGKATASYSLSILKEGQGFAIKARREGNHPYTSMDVGREVGSAVFLANEHRHVRVDLTHPDVTIYVEVRENRAYIFSDYLPGPGGLPMGSQGKVLAVVNSDRDALAAWLIMKRGCKAFILTEDPDGPAKILERWDPKLNVEVGSDVNDALRRRKALAVVLGHGIEQMDRIRELMLDVPVFYPIVGFGQEEIAARIADIKGQ